MTDRAIRYRLGDEVATRRARASAALGAATSLTPVLFALVLLGKLGWRPPAAVWIVAASLLALVAARTVVAYGSARRRLRSVVIVVTDDDIRFEAPRAVEAIERARVARITEIDGPLGGLRVQSQPDARSGVVSFVHVPRGGDAFGEVRRALEGWRPVERRGRRGPAVRVALGAAVVLGMFFAPFLLDDFVARSKLLATGLVFGMWAAMRLVLRRA